MSGISINAELKQAVLDYKRKEKEVSRNFILGIIELGEDLEKKRSKFKQGKIWMTFLNQIDKTLPWANQMIRLYQYSLTNKPAVLNSNLTNWTKLNLFLTVPEDQRPQVAKRIGGGETSNDDFRKAVSDTTDDDKDSKVDFSELKQLVSEKEINLLDSELNKSINEALLEKPSTLANALMKAIKKSCPFITSNSTEAAKAFFSLESAIAFLRETENLTKEEKLFWSEKLTERLSVVKEEVDKLS